MRKTFAIVGLAMVCSLAAFATDVPKYETFLGYDFVRFNTTTGIVPSFNANGGDGQFVYNFHSDFGVAFDFGAVTKGVLGGYSVDTTVVNFLAGPRFALHKHGHFTPFVQALFGGAYGTTSTQITLPFTPGVTPPNVPPTFCPGCTVTPGTTGSTIPISARLVASATHFAMVAGGGLDYRVNNHWSVRPIGIDYYQTQFSGLFNTNHVNQHNIRYTAGVNFTFGAQ